MISAIIMKTYACLWQFARARGSKLCSKLSQRQKAVLHYVKHSWMANHGKFHRQIGVARCWGGGGVWDDRGAYIC